MESVIDRIFGSRKLFKGGLLNLIKKVVKKVVKKAAKKMRTLLVKWLKLKYFLRKAQMLRVFLLHDVLRIPRKPSLRDAVAALIDGNLYREAVRESLRGLRQDPNRIYFHQSLAKSLIKINKPRLARLILMRLLDKYPANSSAKFVAGQLFYAMDEFENAAATLLEVPIEDGRPLSRSLIAALYKANMMEDIADLATKIDGYAFSKPEGMHIIQAFLRLGRWEEAASFASTQIERGSLNGVTLRLGRMAAEKVDKLESFDNRLEKMLCATPSLSQVDCLVEQGNFEQANAVVDKLLKNIATEESDGVQKNAQSEKERTEVLFSKSLIAFSRDDFASCLEILNEHDFAAFGYYGAVTVRKILCYLHLKEYARAQAEFDSYQQKEPTLPNKFRFSTFQMFAGLSRTKDALRLYQKRPVSVFLNNLFPARMAKLKSRSFKEIVVFCEGGPGDELRFATMYPYLEALAETVHCSCEPRLLPLLQAAFPNIRFHPMKRCRVEMLEPTFPGRDSVKDMLVADAIDNEFLGFAQSHGNLFSILELLVFVHPAWNPSSRAAEGLSFQKSLTSKLHPEKWSRQVLNKYDTTLHKKKIGIAWKSMLSSSARDQHYLSFDNAAELARQHPSMYFVSLQYQLSNQEKQEIGRLPNFSFVEEPALNQKDDFLETAAMMKNLDAVIAPCTTVAEFAGFLGIDTLMFSNSPMNNYRHAPENDEARRSMSGEVSDFWHKSLRFVEPEAFGDKADVMRKLSAELAILE